MNDNRNLGSMAMAELLAKRRTEDRPFFTLSERPGGGAVHAWWLRRPGSVGMEQRWSRTTLPNSDLGAHERKRVCSAHQAVHLYGAQPW